MSLRLTLSEKGGWCRLKLLATTTEFSVFHTSGQSTREQLARKCFFFEGQQNYIENKNEGNESKIILADFICTVDKMDRYDGNKTRRQYIDVVQLCSVKTHCG